MNRRILFVLAPLVNHSENNGGILTMIKSNPLDTFEKLESEVRAYCRSFPAVFTKAKGSKIWDQDDNEYIDFLSGAGSLNYGHNHPLLKEKLVNYILSDQITHSLDMATQAKEAFLKDFHKYILKPRKLDYKVMFPGPTGTNTVESALKLARKFTGRTNVISFTNSFHGMTIGALSVTGNAMKRAGAGVPLHDSISIPYDHFLDDEFDTIHYLEKYLSNAGSGLDKPAAVILETVQGEGGINVARFEWIKKIEEVCRKWDILLIIDDVQAGNGRTGTFFSFEKANIYPDIVCISKSISGYGLPMALTLFKPHLDIWKPGEHNGTFRGNNHAFVTARAALDFWRDPLFERELAMKSELVHDFLTELVEVYPEIEGEVRGRGLMKGVACGIEGLATEICHCAFERGLIMETAGPNNEVFKLFPPLTISFKELEAGLSLIEQSTIDALNKRL